MIFFIFKNINNKVHGFTIFFLNVCVSLRLCVADPSLMVLVPCCQGTLPTSKEGHCGYVPEGDTHASMLSQSAKS
jgi:hypothetical protein